MIPLIKRIVNALLFDELAATRWLRGLIGMFAVGGVAFAESIARTLEDPSAAKWIKLLSSGAVFVSLAITAGERNPR